MLNFSVNLAVCVTTQVVLRRAKPWRGSVMVSLLGTVFALGFVYVTAVVTYKLACGIVLTYLLWDRRTVKSYITTFGIFVLTTNLMAGIVYCLLNVTSKIGSNQQYYTAAYYLLLGLSAFSCIYIQKICNWIRRRLSERGNVYSVTLCSTFGRVMEKGLVDSGNLLVTKEGLPVIVISRSVVKQLKLPSLQQAVKVVTIGGEAIKMLYCVPSLSITAKDGTREYTQVYAVESDSLRSGYGVLLHGTMRA